MLVTTMPTKDGFQDNSSDAGAGETPIAADLESSRVDLLCGQLLRWPRIGARELALSRPLAGHPQVIRRLVQQTSELVHTEPQRALSVARIAVACSEVARHLVRDAALVADLRCEAWTALANAQRVIGDHHRADRSFARATAYLSVGKGSTSLAADLHRKRATLRAEQRRFDEAETDLREAASLSNRAGDKEAAARCQFILGWIYSLRGAIEQAFFAVAKALRTVDPEATPELYFQGLHRQAQYLSELGRSAQALALSGSLEHAYAAFGGGVVQLRGLWLRGKIHSDLHEWAVAAAYFERVRDSFLNRGMLYDAALAGLDLALAYSELGRRDDVRKLAEEMYDVFTAQQIPREASAALLLFADSALARKADAAFIREIGRQLEAMRRAAPSL